MRSLPGKGINVWGEFIPETRSHLGPVGITIPSSSESDLKASQSNYMIGKVQLHDQQNPWRFFSQKKKKKKSAQWHTGLRNQRELSRGETRIGAWYSGRAFLLPHFSWPVPTLLGLHWRTAPSTGPILSTLWPRLSSACPQSSHCIWGLPLSCHLSHCIILAWLGVCLPTVSLFRGRAWVQQTFVK